MLKRRFRVKIYEKKEKGTKEKKKKKKDANEEKVLYAIKARGSYLINKCSKQGETSGIKGNSAFRQTPQAFK
jgi:hypothetical protein